MITKMSSFFSLQNKFSFVSGLFYCCNKSSQEWEFIFWSKKEPFKRFGVQALSQLWHKTDGHERPYAQPYQRMVGHDTHYSWHDFSRLVFPKDSWLWQAKNGHAANILRHFEKWYFAILSTIPFRWTRILSTWAY